MTEDERRGMSDMQQLESRRGSLGAGHGGLEAGERVELMSSDDDDDGFASIDIASFLE